MDEGLWSPDGQWIVFRTGSGGINTRDLWAIRPGVDSVPRPVATSQYDEFSPALSPDGRWLAYVSTESGRREVYVRPFPDAERARWQVSVEGGSQPLWSPTGSELFYRTPRGEMMAVSVAPGAAFAPQEPTVLFLMATVRVFGSDYHQAYDVARDGRRFLMITTPDEREGEVVLVLNWQREVEERLRSRR